MTVRLVARTLRTLVAALEETFGASLVGIYVYGSLTQRAFDPKRSDIDCLVVVRRNLTERQFRQLRDRLAADAVIDPWIRRVQMQILLAGRLLRSDTRGALYQFGTLARSGSDGNPLIWLNVLATGLTLVGPNPRSLLPPITERMVVAALVREVGYLRAEISNRQSRWRGKMFYRAYAVLTLCRILYTWRTGGVVSKARAAAWALRTLPAGWHSLVRAALASNQGRRAALPLRGIARFIAFVDGEVG